MRLIDAFLYNGEDIVDIRLEYLKNHIDHFYIFESNVTQNGILKKRYSDDILKKLSHLSHKITLINLDEHVDLMPMSQDINYFCSCPQEELFNAATHIRNVALQREKLSRDVMHSYLATHLKPSDILYFADADEMPTIETLDYIKSNGDNLLYPLYILGECFDGDTHFRYANQQLFWFEAFFIRAALLKTSHSLDDIRFKNHFHMTNLVSYDENILIKDSTGIYLKNDMSIIKRKRHETDNGFNYLPLMFHLRNFFDACGYYKKHLHSTFYIKPGFDYTELKNYFFADYAFFKEKCQKIYINSSMDMFYENPYLKSVLPDMIYNFGYSLAKKRSVAPDNFNLHHQYNELYEPFKEKLLGNQIL